MAASGTLLLITLSLEAEKNASHVGAALIVGAIILVLVIIWNSGMAQPSVERALALWKRRIPEIEIEL